MRDKNLAELDVFSFGYLCRCGRCRLNNVHVKNRGVDWECQSNIYWQNKIQRLETLEVFLEGDAEFEAHNVTIEVCGFCALLRCL